MTDVLIISDAVSSASTIPVPATPPRIQLPDGCFTFRPSRTNVAAVIAAVAPEEAELEVDVRPGKPLSFDAAARIGSILARGARAGSREIDLGPDE